MGMLAILLFKALHETVINANHHNIFEINMSVNGILGHEARMFVNCLGDSIADMWQKSHSEVHVMGWVRVKMSFAILRATNLCLRGSRRKWRRVMDINDGAGLPSYMD